MRYFNIPLYLTIFSLVIISCKKNPTSSEDNSNSDDTDNNSAKIEFEDNFSSNNLDWQIYGGNWYLDDNALFIDGPNDSLQHWAYYETESSFTQPLEYSVDVGYFAGNDNNSLYGIGLAITAVKAIVYLIDDSYHKYCVKELDSSGWNTLIDWSYYSEIKRGPSPIKIIYENDSLKLYYNDKKFYNVINKVDVSFYELLLFHQGTEKIKFDDVSFSGSVSE
jgi:hypothetical protein